MKIIKQINLNQKVFHIDEDAYDVLQNHLNNFKGNINDEEIRLEQHFSALINAQKQVITIRDVNEILNIEAQPEDRQQYTTPPPYERTRLFRDREDKVLGGVASGIAHFLDVQSWVIRLAFIILFFTFGSGFLIYFLLWILIPPAVSQQDKYDMHRNKTDYRAFGQQVRAEYEQTKNNIRNNQSSGGKQVEFLFSEIFRFIGNLFRILFKFFGILLVIVLLFPLGVIVLGVFASVFGAIFHGFRWHWPNFHIPHWNFNWDWHFPHIDSEFGLVMLLLVAIPLIGLVIGMLRSLFNLNPFSFMAKFALTVVWLLLMFFLVFKVIDGRKTEKFTHYIPGTSFNPSKTLVLIGTNNYMHFDTDLSFDLHDNTYSFDFDSEKLLIEPDFDVYPTKSDSIEILIKKQSFYWNKHKHKRTSLHWTIENNTLSIQDKIKSDIGNSCSFPRYEIEIRIPSEFEYENRLED